MYMIYLWWGAVVFICSLLVVSNAISIPLGQRRLQALQRMIQLLCAVVLALLISAHYGLFFAIVGTLCVTAVALAISQLGVFQRLGNDLYQKHVRRLVPAIARSHWLDYISEQKSVGRQIGLATHDELASVIHSADFLRAHERTMLEAVLRAPDVKASDVMHTITNTVVVSETDVIGPLLLDELHRSGQQVFPVVNEQGSVKGIVYLSSLIELSAISTTVKQALTSSLVYVDADDSISITIERLIKARAWAAIVRNKEPVGIIVLEDALHALLGKHPS